MRSKNAVSLIGMVGADAEVRSTQQGVQYARFSLATSTGGYAKQDGTKVPEQTQWHHIVVWRKLAEFAGKYVKKGMKVAVDGMITYGQYTNQQGQKVDTCEILANDLVLMTIPQSQQAGQPAPQVQPTQVAQPAQPQAYSGGVQQSVFQQPANNGYQQQQGGYGQNDNAPFPPPVGADGLPF